MKRLFRVPTLAFVTATVFIGTNFFGVLTVSGTQPLPAVRAANGSVSATDRPIGPGVDQGQQDQIGPEAQAQAPASTRDVLLQGSGATFPNPLYQKWFAEYNIQHPNIRFDYESIGSGGGIKQICSGTVDFAGSDFPLTDDQLSQAPAGLLHIPTVLGAVVVTYNLPSLGALPLKLSGETLAAIFLGEIKKWDDPEITRQNPDVDFPNADILVVHRSDSTGSSLLFTDFLSKVSPEWKQKVGTAPVVDWPVGVGAKGSEGVAGEVKGSENSIGYVDFIYARYTNLIIADVKDAEGEFIHPTLESITAAAARASADIPPDLRASITLAPGNGAYPISALSYILVYKEQKDRAKGEALAKFLLWVMHHGQALSPEMNYAPLPPEIVQMAERQIKSMTFQTEVAPSSAAR